MKHVLFALVMGCLPLMAFQGVYVGGSVGGHVAKGSQDGSALGTYTFLADGLSTYPLEVQPELFDRGAASMLYAGYGTNWGSFYLAAEGLVQFGSANLKSSQQSTALFLDLGQNFTIAGINKATIKSCQYGIDFLPGWSPTVATLLYGRIGTSAARLSLGTNTTNLGTDDTDSWNLPLSLSKSKTVFTLRAGCGLEQRLARRLTLRADYIYSDFGTLSKQGSQAGTSANGRPITVSSDSSIHLYDHAVLLGLCYRLSCLDSICWDPCCSPSFYQGYYLGGALGGSILTSSLSGRATGRNPQLGGLIQPVDPVSQLDNTQFQGALYLGYGAVWKRLYLGEELFAAAASHTSMNNEGIALLSIPAASVNFSTSYDLSVKTSTWQYGFDLKPGALLTPFTLLYGRVGISATEIKVQSNALSARSGGGVSWAVPVSSTAHQWKAAFRLGLGVEQLLTERLHLRADYVLTNYKRLSLGKKAVGQDNSARVVTIDNTLSNHLQNHAVTFGLSYYFNAI
ncbi:MAG: hypothetical protein S4CHLAM2_05960 [Chlamydiales bacterium]|nr:hypothetical protein [Chlamydiales bacterium]